MLLYRVLFILPLALSTPPPLNIPDGWSCAPLSQITTSPDCVTASSYSGGVWSISTSNGGAANANAMCVIQLSGDKVHKSSDFYVKASFGNSAAGPGPFGGITFNMEDTDNANYVMMRLKVPVPANVQAGKLVGGVGTMLKQSVKANAAVTSGAATLEILVQEDEETVWIEGVKEESISANQPFYVAPGAVGFGFQQVTSWAGIEVTGAEVCTPLTCEEEDGTVHSGGDQWVGEDLKTCTCTAEGIVCVCGDDDLTCAGGTQKWTDPEDCVSKCIRDPSYCYSSGDPHYGSFDNKYFDFHGVCTYQAASCDDFQVYFKNVDLHGRAPRYTGRIEITFKNHLFVIGRGNQALVDGDAVQVPYTKTWTNGDRMEIINNGQLEMLLYSKGRSPAVRVRQTNYGTWITAEMWLHGSCADVTEGLCGTPNGNAADDLINGDPNQTGEKYKKYDENCPAPPEPWHPCDAVPGGKEAASDVCNVLNDAPFSDCHSTVAVGDVEEGQFSNCVKDVCNCFIDPSCACSQFDTYAEKCINAGVDSLADWRASVLFCPYDCPEGQTYGPIGATPVPTCLNKDPEQTGTVRGCFCPDGQFLQDGECVDANQCKCLYEGQFYNNGDEIDKKAECQQCTCLDGGSMECGDFPCPDISCDDNELEAYRDDDCCPYCDDSWVEALNPDNTIKKGQNVVLTCAVHVDVSKKDIVWYKGDKKITKNISRNKLRLTIKDADADDDGEYRCEASKDGKVNSDTFDVDVVMPAICEHADGTTWEEATIYNPQETEECTCNAQGEHECSCIDDGEECEDPTPVVWFDDECMKSCVPDYGSCSAAADPQYTTFDGSHFDFKGDCKYNFFGCGDVKMFADHEKREVDDVRTAKTKYIEVVFKGDVYKLEGNAVTLNGGAVVVPLHKVYSDGSVLSMSDIGSYTLTIVQDGKDPLVELTWDKVSSYSIKVHGTCKGQSTGMCGTWDGESEGDLTTPDGEIANSVEDFGTAWAVDDEEDCPAPPPPPDFCTDFGLAEQKPGYVESVEDILKAGKLGKCTKGKDFSVQVAAAVQQVCLCFGDLTCACPILSQVAVECETAGFITSGWELDKSTCTPSCPEPATFNERGPKPAPSCRKPNGGKKTQAGCFCPDGQVLEEGECMAVSECKCEYAGQRYDIGEKYRIEAECKKCECVDNAKSKCEDLNCNTDCDADEIEIAVEGECCPQCLADWVEAVNPNPEGTIGEALVLECMVDDDVDVIAENIIWIKTDPDTDLSKLKKFYTISDDGLTLTIKKVNEKRIGGFKCVVEKDGKTSEGVFDVTLPIVHEDLIEPVEETVNFVSGQDLRLEVTKLGGVITDLAWECDGVPVVNGEGGFKIVNKKSSSRLVIKAADKDAAPESCICKVKGIGSQDSAEIEVTAEENTITVTPKKKKLTCVIGKKKCSLKFTVEKLAGSLDKKAVKICKLNEDGSLTACKTAKFKKKKSLYQKGLGKIKASHAGLYVAVYQEKGGPAVQSDPVTVTAKEKTKGK